MLIEKIKPYRPTGQNKFYRGKFFAEKGTAYGKKWNAKKLHEELKKEISHAWISIGRSESDSQFQEYNETIDEVGKIGGSSTPNTPTTPKGFSYDPVTSDRDVIIRKADYILYEIYADYLHEILNLVSDNPDNEAKIREVLEQYKNAEREYKNSGEKVNTWLLLSKVYRANQVLIDPKVEKASPSNETNENACDQSGEEINPDLIKDAANTPLLEGDDEELRETDTTNSDEPLIPEISSPLTQTTTISFKPFELPADEKFSSWNSHDETGTVLPPVTDNNQKKELDKAPPKARHVPTPITVPKSRTSYSEVLISPKIIKTSKRKSVIESVGVGESGDYIITTPEIPASGGWGIFTSASSEKKVSEDSHLFEAMKKTLGERNQQVGDLKKEIESLQSRLASANATIEAQKNIIEATTRNSGSSTQSENVKLEQDIFATLTDLKGGWKSRQEGGERGTIIVGYEHKLAWADNPNFEDLLEYYSVGKECGVEEDELKYVRAAREVFGELGLHHSNFPKYDPRVHGENQEAFIWKEFIRRGSVLKQVHDKLKHDCHINIYQDKDWATKVVNWINKDSCETVTSQLNELNNKFNNLKSGLDALPGVLGSNDELVTEEVEKYKNAWEAEQNRPQEGLLSGKNIVIGCLAVGFVSSLGVIGFLLRKLKKMGLESKAIANY